MSEMSGVETIATTGSSGGGGGRVEREFTIKERSQSRMVLQRFLKHKLAVFSLIGLVIVILVVFIVPSFWPYSYEDLDAPFSTPPTLKNPFGTDSAGHDLFARVMRGAQQSLQVALLVTVLSTGIGAPWGAIAGLIGGKVDMIMMRFCDVLLVLPVIAVAGAINGNFGGRWWVVALVLGLLGWVVDARVVRGVVLSLREQEFIEAARALGGGTLRIVFRHLLPNATGVIIVLLTLNIAAAILAEAGLSFIGVGVQPPDTSLGLLTNEARDAVQTRPWLFYIPGTTIIIIALFINFIGDGLRDAFDPRQQRKRQ